MPKLNWWETFAVSMLAGAVNADPQATPQMKAIANTMMSLLQVDLAGQKGSIAFIPATPGVPTITLVSF